MRSYRPSRSAMIAIGAVTMTLLVAGTSGAVAGKLITSKQIKDGTIKTVDLKDDSVTNAKIAPGAVDWEKSLSEAAKEQIESFVSEGVPGPAGPEGPRGPRGLEGPTGAAGMGRVVFWDYFGFEEPDLEEASEDGYELPPLNGRPIVLDQPGDYLLNMNGIVMATGPDSFGAAIVPGEPSTEETFIFDACIPSGFSFVDLPLATCETSVPISVEAGETLELPINVVPAFGPFDDCGSESCPPPLAAARVVVYQISSTPTADPVVPGPCRTDLGKDLRKLAARAC
jgi:hypothetical protein